ncbi:MAG: hypothetical protein IJH07_09235 [Ruminococcus sp.]|nr:hypothetical protein [Ruminococcus sp.]
MKEKLISKKFTFSEICSIFNERNDAYTKLFHQLFDAALLFCPALKLPAAIASAVFEQDITVSILEAKEHLKTCIEDVAALIRENTPGSYYKKYNDMLLAHFLLVFSAYYDAVRALLPEKNYHVPLDDEITLYITEDALKNYAEKFEDSSNKTIEWGSIPDFPHDLTFYTFYEEELEKLYQMLTDEFFKFYHHILNEEKIPSAVADAVSARIRGVPKLAKDIYRAQYFSLKEKFSLFSEYSNTGEHKIIADKIDQLLQIAQETAGNNAVKRAAETFKSEERYCKSQVCKKILYGGDDEYDMLPAIEDCFLPQSYKSIVFRSEGKNRTVLGPDETWADVEEKDDLIAYIGQTVSSPPFDRKPIIILGEPGGGKSTLSKILAAKVFSLQYYVIVVKLREVNAGDRIPAMIEQQIKRDISEDITWSEMRNCIRETDIPLLIIFDGYDELLRAGGIEYAGFIRSVYDFQKNQEEVYDFLIRTIITGRKNLIDLADLPNNSAVICLQEFSERKVDEWIERWNQHNAARFEARRVQPFAVRPRYAYLTKQPLLLTMLAMYDYEANALAQDHDWNSADVYRNLLDNYVKLELKNTKPAAAVWGTNGEEIMHEFLRVASMGMLNRRQLYLTKEQFEQDLYFYGVRRSDEKPHELDDGVKLFGSFFFVNTSKVKELSGAVSVDKYTFEFLHATFGEYLAADHIWKQYARVITECSEDGQVSEKTMHALYVSIAFMCLSEKPNLLHMITEINGEITAEQASDYLTGELKEAVTGKLFLRISKWLDGVDVPYESYTLLRHAALYAMNLISISAFANSECHAYLSAEEWRTLIQFLRAGLREKELEVFSYLHYIEPYTEGYHIYRQKPSPGMISAISKAPHVEKLHLINHAMVDELNLAFSGTVYADYLSEPYIDKHGLELKSELYYGMMVKRMYPSDNEIGTLFKAQTACFDEFKYDVLSALYIFAQRKYASDVNVKRQLFRFCIEGMKRFESIPETSFFDAAYGETVIGAFLELLNLSRLVRIDYHMYERAMGIIRKLPLSNREERFAVIGFAVDAIPRISPRYRYSEIERTLSGIGSYIHPGKRIGSAAASFYIRSIGELFGGFMTVNVPPPEAGIYSLADRIMGDIMVKCQSLHASSKEAKQVILAYITQLYFRNHNLYDWLIENLSHNHSFILLFEEWLHALPDHSDRTVLVMWKTVSYLKALDVRFHQKTISRTAGCYLANRVSDTEITAALRSAADESLS